MNEGVALPGRHGRKYRSKKQRPCDLCRTRKTQCKLQGDGVDCELCQRLGRQCSFVVGPVSRKYRRRGEGEEGEGEEEQESGGGGDENATGRAMVDGGMYDPDVDPHLGLDMDMSMEMEMDGFWLPPTTGFQQQSHQQQHTFVSQDVQSQLMNYYAMGSSLGEQATIQQSGGLTATDAASGRNMDESDGHPRRPRTDIAGAECSPGVPSPADSMMRRASQGTAPASVTTASGESPASVCGTSGLRNIRPARTISEMDSDDSVPRRVANAREALGGGGNGGRHSSGWPHEFSLESRRGYSNHLIGLSCESDPFLLRHYRYNSHDTYRMFRLDFRKVVEDVKMPRPQSLPAPGGGQPPHLLSDKGPIQFMMCDEAIWQDDIKATERLLSGAEGTEAADMALLNKTVNPRLGARLLKLYTRFVHPRYPVLSLSDLKRIPESDCTLSFPIGIRSAVYALAAPFVFLDDELSVSKGYLGVPTEDLWAIAHRSFQRASCLSHITLLQLCLLLLQMPPQNFVVAEPTKFWALSCSAVATAENLGVNMEPSGWRLPKEDIMLRRRLWWLTYTAHTWHALVCGRPSHINEANWYVSKLTEGDFEKGEHETSEVRDSIQAQIPICIANCELGIIAAGVLQEFFTVRASCESPSLESLLSRAQPIRTRIESWRQTLPLLSIPLSELSEDDFDNGAPLRLSRLTLEVLIFRALLRPLSYDTVPAAEKCQEPISTIFENCYVCGNVATEIVSFLRGKHFASFWQHYTRYQLCYVSGFLLLNLALSATREMAVRNREVLSKWRDTLRTQARAWPLARLAAMRLDAVFWKGLISVIHGAGPESPAIRLLKESASKETDDG